jgi:4-hydroxy-tetrahydrodipicolinate reductase
MKLALVGYGKMGKRIDQLAPEFGFEVAARLDLGFRRDELVAVKPDVAIEFSSPEAAVANLELLAEAGIATVCGTTGWYGEIDRVRQAFLARDSALVYASNFSIGVNIFQRLVAEAARQMASQSDYPPRARVRIPALTKSASIRRPIPSLCAIPPGAAMASRAGRCVPHNGLRVSAAFTHSPKFSLEVEHVPRMWNRDGHSFPEGPIAR